MAHLARQVDERFRQAFSRYLIAEVVPLLDGTVIRISGRVFSHYDQPQFAALPGGRSRYYYEISFFSDDGSEDACGELDYDPVGGTWSPSKVKPPTVRTLTQKRELDLLHQAMHQSRQHHVSRPAQCPHCRSVRVAVVL